MKDRNFYLFSLRDISKAMPAMVGGKGANLAELSKMEGIQVPDGFCVSTKAFQRILEETPLVNELLDQLSLLTAGRRDKVAELSAEIRAIIEGIAMPEDLAEEVAAYLAKSGEKDAYAVRSSATAEDLPTASFAGQQDTYLNVIGKEAILRHISKCWASLYTDRAVIYRMQNGFDHRKVRLAVVVQKMIFPQVSGILFTADPVTSNRRVVSIDAGFGLGEALVSGKVNADIYKVRDGKIIDKKISVKKLAIHALKDGGIKEQEIAPEQQNRQALTDDQILQLEHIGRKIEAHFGNPQDIEWCLADDTFYIVQSRPITTLFPIPEANDRENHVYISVGHQQMMTDAMKPLGLSFYLLLTPAPMRTAGGRLFVDGSHLLATTAGREQMINVLGKNDPLIKDAFITLIGRDYIKLLPDGTKEQGPGKDMIRNYQALNDYDPAIVDELIKRSEESIATLKLNIQQKSGPELIDFILDDVQERKKSKTDMQGFEVIMTGMNAAHWINEKIEEWLGEKNVADTLSQSVPHNVTSEMGLELLDVADRIRPYPEVIAYLQQVKDDNFPEELPKLRGGKEVREAIMAYLDKYGMRCAGEIDITKPRWAEKPGILIPLLLGNIKNFEPGESRRRFEQGQQEALKKEQELLAKLKQVPGGEEKIKETKRMIYLLRNLAGYREYPKYAIVSRFFIYKKALLKEAERLVQAGVLRNKEDIYFFLYEEFREAVRTHKVDHQLIAKRKDEFASYEKLNPPRVFTSDGEIITGTYKHENLPAGAIAGLPVSSGVVEGRARVILNIEDADLEEGDILVTSFTDPSWTPLFVSIKGLVTEVGGLMTHGAVIAREYGLPAVVGVENATKLIRDGQNIRVDGTNGYIYK